MQKLHPLVYFMRLGLPKQRHCKAEHSHRLRRVRLMQPFKRYSGLAVQLQLKAHLSSHELSGVVLVTINQPSLCT